MMHQQDELALKAYQQAVSEIGNAGWTTCQMFIEQRVKELLHPEKPRPCTNQWRTDCDQTTLGYEAL